MKKIFFIASLVVLTGISSCTKKQFSDAYVNPQTVSSTTIEKQFSGFLASNLDYTMYKYWNYFVVLQNTALPWTQAVGMVNNPGRYVPGAAAISDRWGNFYNFLSQYKEFVNVYNKASEAEKKDKRIYFIAATIYFYDHSEKVVDLHGDIPWSEAGLLSTNGGDYSASYAKYDDAAAIYTKMLDDLKAFADEMNTISVPAPVTSIMRSQDFVNHADLSLWKKYCNSLRVRMLTRVSGVSALQSRATSELASITGSPATYPVVASNSDNIMIEVYNRTTGINNGTNTGLSCDFHTGLIGWGFGDVPSKPLVDFMKNNTDPRLRAMFQPGANAGTTYNGLDVSLSSSAQTTSLNSGTLSLYNYSTLQLNTNIPGMLINAAEVYFALAEYYLKAGNDAAAKTAYENGVNASIDYYFWLPTISDYSGNTPSALVPAEKTAYLASAGVSWAGATTTAAKLNLIATQKWINYSVIEPLESWAEIRRLKLPALTFVSDATNAQTQPPKRWVYPNNEQTYNKANYEAVKSKDNFTTKIFWDVN